MRLIILVFLLFLTGCSALGAVNSLNPLKDDKGIDTTIQLGKENTAIDNKALAQIDARSETKSTVSNDIRADNMSQFTSYKDSPWLIIAFAIMAGFAIPNPFSYYSHRRQIRDLREANNDLAKNIYTLNQPGDTKNGSAKNS